MIKNLYNYGKEIMDHFDNPRNVGTLDDSKPTVGKGMVGSPKCGDVFCMYIDVDTDTKVISDVKFKSYGCASAIASASFMTEKVKGKTIEEALKVTNMDIACELKLPKIKIHCSCLAANAFKEAVKDWRRKNEELDDKGQSKDGQKSVDFQSST